MGPLGRAVASAWYARGTVPYRRERVAPTGSTVAVIVLGDPIIETAGGPRAVPLRADRGFLIGPHDRPVTNEPTGETFAVGIVTTPVGCRAALGLDPAAVAGRVVELDGGLARRRRPAGAPAGGRPTPRRCWTSSSRAWPTALDLDVPGLDRCERAVAMLEEDPVRPIADIAAAVGVSHGHLDREFTRIVGLAPRRLARLLRVERLLGGDRRRRRRPVGGPRRGAGLGGPVAHDPRRQAPHRVDAVRLRRGTACVRGGDRSGRVGPVRPRADVKSVQDADAAGGEDACRTAPHRHPESRPPCPIPPPPPRPSSATSRPPRA